MGIIKYLTFIFLFISFSLSGLTVERVTVNGAVRTEQSVITNKVSKGDISEEELDKLLKEIYKLKLFEHVDISYDKEKKELIFNVIEFPIITKIEYYGYDEIAIEDIKEVVDLKTNELLDIEKINRNVTKIQDLYKEKGFLLAFIDHKIIRNKKNNEITVKFLIDEGTKSRVKQVRLVGNNFLEDGFIKQRLGTQQDGIFSYFGDGGYKKELLDEDQQRIMFLYNEVGFVNVRVSKPIVNISPDKKEIYITFIINEGKRYKINNIEVKGDKLDAGKYPQIQFGLQKGDWYKHTELINDLERLKIKYGDEGYPFVTVVPERKNNDKEQSLDVIYHIQKGEKCTVERIDITGHNRSRDKVIRREIKLYEGDLFSLTNQKRSKARIKRTGFYDEVNIRIEKGSAPGLARVIVNVTERKSGTFNIGAGFSSFESFLLNARVEQSNFLGWGQTISLNGQMSSVRQMFDVSVFEPYLLDKNLSLNTKLYYNRTDYAQQYSGYYSDFNENRYGLTITIGKPINDYFTAYFGYSLRNVEIGGAIKRRMKYLFRDIFTSSIENILSYDSRNDRMFPSKGIYTYLRTEFSPKFLGSDDNIIQLDYNFRFYRALLWDVVFRANLNVAWAHSLSNDHLPFAERFRLGGIFSIRGYPFNSIGPSVVVNSVGTQPDSSTSDYIIGGDKKIVLNNELEIPIVKEMRLKFVGFIDVGNAWKEDENFFYIDTTDKNKYDLPVGMYWSWGFGLRWVTPIAPLSFEWGFPITPRPGDPTYMFEFNIKNSF